MYISDWFTFLTSKVGILLSLIGIWIAFSRRAGGPDADTKENVEKWINDKNNRYERIRIVLKDYETSISEIHARNNINLMVGTILIGASFFILTSINLSERSRSVGIYAFASIGLYSIWLFLLYLTSSRLNGLQYSRIRAIEEALTEKLNYDTKKLKYDFGINSYNIKKTRRCGGKRPALWLRIRRAFWDIVLLLLSIAWMLFSLEY